MAAGTILHEFSTLHASYALTIPFWCRADTSGEVPHTSHAPRLPALDRSDGSPTQDFGEQSHAGHRSMFHHCPIPVPTLSYRETKGHSDTYGVSPQQVETGQLLQCPDLALPWRRLLPGGG